MVRKFKKGDTVFIRGDKQRRKSYGLGKVIDYTSYPMVRWPSGPVDEYHDNQLRHKHRIIMSFRYLWDRFKEQFLELRKEASQYIEYRRFKVGNIVCLKTPTSTISVCDFGKIVKKSYPALIIEWQSAGQSLYRTHYQGVEHYIGVDPNKLFKRNMS